MIWARMLVLPALESQSTGSGRPRFAVDTRLSVGDRVPAMRDGTNDSSS